MTAGSGAGAPCRSTGARTFRARVCSRRSVGPLSSALSICLATRLLASRSPSREWLTIMRRTVIRSVRVAGRVVGAARGVGDERASRPGANGSARAARRRPPTRRRPPGGGGGVAASACLAVACASNFSLAACIVSVNGMPAAPSTKSLASGACRLEVSSASACSCVSPLRSTPPALTPWAIVGSGAGWGCGCGSCAAAGTAAARAQRIARSAGVALELRGRLVDGQQPATRRSCRPRG